MAASDFDEGAYRVSQPFCPEVVPEDAWCPGMSHYVSVSLMQVVLGERPVIQGRPCVVVLYKGHGSGRPHPQQTRGPALAVYQSPVFPSAHGFLQDACIPAGMCISTVSLQVPSIDSRTNGEIEFGLPAF